MARRARRQRAVSFFTNGKYADDRYALSKHVGQIVKRTDVARQRATATLARRAPVFVRRNVQQAFNIPAKQLMGKFPVRDEGGALRVFGFTRRIPLFRFAGRWRGRKTPGATAQVLRGQRDTYAHSFIAAVGKSNPVAGIRVRRGKERGPLAMLYGPSPRDMVIGRKTDPVTGEPSGLYPTSVGKQSLQQMAEFYIAELKRLYAMERQNGK